MRIVLTILAATVLVATLGQGAPAMSETTPQLETAVLGGGCFWCMEAVFEELKGVTKVVDGYAGGTVADPSYKQVCTGDTGHAEAVKVTFDPSVISYGELLTVFFSVHDPTSLNRQGADEGTQYRSVIFTQNDAQRKTAEEIIKELTEKKVYDRPIVTQVVPLPAFYPAEDYHQDYFAKNPDQAYCQVVISPKVRKFRQEYHDRLKK